MPVSVEDRASPLHVDGVCCTRCHGDRTTQQRESYAERQRQMTIAARLGIDHVGAVQAPSRPTAPLASPTKSG